MKKSLMILAAASAFAGFGAIAQDAEDPFKDTVEIRHGLMLQMATTMGRMAKGEVPYDAPAATKAAANVAAIASVLAMAQFPAGSEYEKSADSFALPDIWAKPDDFLAKITDLNAAAVAMQGAAGDAETLKTAMAGLGAACSACHKAYRQPES